MDLMAFHRGLSTESVAILQSHAVFLEKRRPLVRELGPPGPEVSRISRPNHYLRLPFELSFFHEVQRAFEFQLEFGAFGESQFVAAA